MSDFDLEQPDRFTAGAIGEVTGVLQLAASLDATLSDLGGVRARGTALRDQLVEPPGHHRMHGVSIDRMLDPGHEEVARRPRARPAAGVEQALAELQGAHRLKRVLGPVQLSARGVGAIPGALPPVIGCVAARGILDVDAWVLFAILFLWQVPHTLAIAWLYREDYAKAGIQFLPVIEPGGSSTNRQIICHCAALLAVSLLPTLLGLAGAVYFIVAFVLGVGFLVTGVRLAMESTLIGARRLLYVSLIYLPVLLLMMALDRVPL